MLTRPALLLTLCLMTLIAQTPKPMSTTHHATGHFDVKLTPQQDSADPTLGRMTISKQFHGDLDGTSVGQMLTGMSERKGSGAYVAIEKFTGKLQGKEGTFILHHTGLMDHGAQSLSIQVVPDSGTGALEGLTGKMTIDVAANHAYAFEYSLPTAAKTPE